MLELSYIGLCHGHVCDDSTLDLSSVANFIIRLPRKLKHAFELHYAQHLLYTHSIQYVSEFFKLYCIFEYHITKIFVKKAFFIFRAHLVITLQTCYFPQQFCLQIFKSHLVITSQNFYFPRQFSLRCRPVYYQINVFCGFRTNTLALTHSNTVVLDATLGLTKRSFLIRSF